MFLPMGILNISNILQLFESTFHLHMSNNNKFTFLKASNYNGQRPNHLHSYVPIYFSSLSEHIQMCCNFFFF